MNETAPITVTVNADTAQAQKNLDSLHDSMAKVIGVAGPKPGWQTSEFWLKLFAVLLTYLYASGTIPTTGVVAQAVAIGATMLGALGYTVVRGQLKKAHALGGLGLPGLSLLDASNDNAAPAPAVKQAGFARLGVMIAIAAIGGALLFGCAGASRQKDAGYALATTLAISGEINKTNDALIQADIMGKAKDVPSGEATLKKYRAARDKVVADIPITMDAEVAFLQFNTDASWSTAQSAFAQLAADVATMKGIK